jgi:hypothetical protein
MLHGYMVDLAVPQPRVYAAILRARVACARAELVVLS